MNKPVSYVLLAVGAVVAAAAVICFSSCGGRSSAVERELAHVDSIMESHPDSALQILNRIDTLVMRKEDRARFSLLKSMALDKNYIDMQTFEVLQPALDYYTGFSKENLRTLYYQARIYQNAGNKNAAQKIFVTAKQKYEDNIPDSLTYARLLVAQAIIFDQIYKLDDFIQNNFRAAEIYKKKGCDYHEFDCMLKIYNGYITTANKAGADSVFEICQRMVSELDYGSRDLLESYLDYLNVFGSKGELKEILESITQLENMKDETILEISKGYLKVGDTDRALEYISTVDLTNDSILKVKYLATKYNIFYKLGRYKEAIDAYVDCDHYIDSLDLELYNNDLLFAEEKHKLIVDNLNEKVKRNQIASISLGLIALLILVLSVYIHRHTINKKKIELMHSENIRLDIERSNLELENQNAELRNSRQRLEIENFRLQVNRLESECDNLKKILNNRTELSKPIEEAIKERIAVLNGLLARAITENDSFAKPFSELTKQVTKDKDKFINSTRLAFKASHPRFIEYLEKHNLTESEINYACLYAIGLRGKEVGEYIQAKGHYNISSSIRKKLGMTEHETNLGIYIRQKMEEL